MAPERKSQDGQWNYPDDLRRRRVPLRGNLNHSYRIGGEIGKKGKTAFRRFSVSEDSRHRFPSADIFGENRTGRAGHCDCDDANLHFWARRSFDSGSG